MGEIPTFSRVTRGHSGCVGRCKKREKILHFLRAFAEASISPRRIVTLTRVEARKVRSLQRPLSCWKCSAFIEPWHNRVDQMTIRAMIESHGDRLVLSVCVYVFWFGFSNRKKPSKKQLNEKQYVWNLLQRDFSDVFLFVSVCLMSTLIGHPCFALLCDWSRFQLYT